MRRALIVFASISWLFVASAAEAEERATMTLRSGKVLTGVLFEFDAKGIWMKVDGQDQSFSPNDVALIQFSDPGPVAEDVKAKLAAGQPFAVLKNGVPVEGRLVDIGGNVPLRLTLRTSSGERELTSNEVAQVYFTAPPAAVAVAAAANPAAAQARAAGAPTVKLDARRGWANTGIRVSRGDHVAFSAVGDVQFAPPPGNTSGPAGNPGVQQGNLPVPSLPVGGLIARIGRGAPFAIGSNTQPIPMPSSGPLLIGINDGDVSDNGGGLDVTIQHQER